jgi:glucose/mannose transport system permease protein
LLRNLGFEEATFDWIVDRDMAIYCVVLAGMWQASGFAMALILAGLRSVDQDLIRAAQIDGASMPRIYRKVILPSIRPIFIAVLVILLQFAIKTFDLVYALTGGGPGLATNVPAIYVYDLMFQRGQIGQGAAAAIMILLALVAVLVPYFLYMAYMQRRESANG